MRATRGVTLGSSLVDLLFPCFCLGCERRLPPHPPPLLLCVRCRGRLRPVRADSRCPTCGRSLPSSVLSSPCAGCLRSPPPFERLLTAWTYAPPLDRIVRALKYGRLDFLAGDLVRLALENEALGAAGPWDLLVPVPLTPWRRLQRGFNQAERIADALSNSLDTPSRGALLRRGFAVTPQVRLGGGDRRRRVVGRFRARVDAGLRGARILLVDDVFTTGSTLAAAASALRLGGAGPITAFALALTPDPATSRLS